MTSASSNQEDKVASVKDFKTQSTIAATVNADGFGAKTISLVGGIGLLINNMTGPGQPELVNAYQQGGWAVCTFWLVLFTVLATLASGLMCEAMVNMKGNENFKGRVELTYMAKKLLPRWAYLLSLFIFLFSFQVNMIAYS